MATTAARPEQITSDELVVLVNESGDMIGTARKHEVHTATTALHRAFSSYLFNSTGQLLITRRALSKVTFPGVWTNSVCGHPAPGEDDHHAIARRARAELGLQVTRLDSALPDFRYRAEMNGIVENEICPVYVGTVIGDITPDPTEVEDFEWLSWSDFLARIDADPTSFSPWCLLQVAQLGRPAFVS